MITKAMVMADETKDVTIEMRTVLDASGAASNASPSASSLE